MAAGMNGGSDGGMIAADGVVWNETCRALRGELGEAAYGSYLAPASLRRGRGGKLYLVTPTGFARDWLKRNVWTRIDAAWTARDPQHRPLELTSRAEFESVADAPAEDPAAVAPAGLAPAPVEAEPPAEAPATPAGGRVTFDTFVASPTNEFALSVARQVAAWSAQSFNPVVLHGPTGWGKSHLLSAIAQEAQRRRPAARVMLLSSEKFLSTFVRAVLDKAGSAFKDEVRAADLLLIDDLQFIGGKRAGQEELFHTLAALMADGRRVVFAANKPPAGLNELEPRLRSHLQAGLSCGIERGDRALRLGVIERKLKLLAAETGCQDRLRPEVAALLADRFPDDIREVEGGLNMLVFRVGERLASLTEEEAAGLLKPILKGVDRRVTVDEIQKATCEHFTLKQVDLVSQRRTRAVSRPRQVAMYLAKTLTTRSYPDIGRRFGGRDHTTVMHAVRTIDRLRLEDPAIAGDLEAITARLRG